MLPIFLIIIGTTTILHIFHFENSNISFKIYQLSKADNFFLCKTITMIHASLCRVFHIFFSLRIWATATYFPSDSQTSSRHIIFTVMIILNNVVISFESNMATVTKSTKIFPVEYPFKELLTQFFRLQKSDKF